MSHLIEFDSVSKMYGKVVALRKVNLRVEEGVSGLVGPNGAGKSTVIKAILGLIRPDKGTVRAFGLDPWTHGEDVRRRMGVLHEKPEFPRWATGYQLVRMVSEFRGIEDPEKESETKLRRFGLGDSMRRSVGTYSAGMVQRLGLAQALVGNPELVILDEPTGNLDPDGRREVLELVGETHRDQGTSFLLSSHVLPELQRVSDHLIIMNLGSVLEEGQVEDLMSKHCLWTRRIRYEKEEKGERIRSSFRGASEITMDAGFVTIRSSSKKLLQEGIDGLVSSGVIRPSDIEEEDNLMEELYMKVLRSGSARENPGAK